MNTEDRRTPGMARVAFDGVVEVGGTLGPSFEASAVDVSEEGMHLRSAYLPELGQQITCRFEAGPNQSVVGSGEVVWSQGADKGGEFGIRFTEMDAECVEALKRVCGVQSDSGPAPAPPGGKVRLYIEGLASPMRAKIRESQSGALTVGSDLGFLQVGKRLDLENTQTGDKRPATIDRVDIDVDPSSRVPQLVVTLRYVDGASAVSGVPAPRDTSPSGSDAHADEAHGRMRGAFAEQAARVGPAVDRAMRRMKTTIGLLAKGRSGDDDPTPRRMTAPAPGGGLRTDGRRVVRGESAFATDGSVAPGAAPKVGHFGRRRVAIGAAVMATAVLGAFAMKHSHQDPSAVAAPPGSSEATPAGAAPPPPAPEQPAPAAPAAQPVVAAPPAPPPAMPAQAVANAASGEDKSGGPQSGAEDGPKKHARAQPFSNGPVHHGNILRLKMDGPVETIEGAQEPTGFLVKLPGRRSLEPASPLAARDGRIQTIKVANGASGAELSVTFKDSVPNYRISARGDSLVIALAPIGPLQDTTVADSAVGKRTSRGGKASGHLGHTPTPAGAER